MRKSILFMVLILLICFSAVVYANEGDIKIFLNSNELKVSVNPVIVNGTTLVPMRNVFETLGLIIEWNDETQTVTGISDQTTIKLTVGNKTAYVNGVERELLVAPRIINGSVMVPIRFVSETTGCEVNWDSKTKTIEIYSQENKGPLYIVPGEGFYEEYTLLKGYEDEDKYQVYFQGDAESFMTTINDLRGINLDEIITWEYNGKHYKGSIRELYGLFSDSLKIKSIFGISPGEELSDKWFIDIFGDVYLDWVTRMGYSIEAPNLVREYFKQTGQINLDRNSLLTPDAIIELEYPDEEEQKREEEELKKRIEKLLESGETVAP